MTGVRSGGGRAGLLAALALAAAVIAGGAAGYALGRRGPPPRGAGPDVTLLGLSRDSVLDSLRLAPAQRAAIDSLLDDASQRTVNTVRGMMADIRDVTGEARRRMRAVLDDTQRARFDSILAAAAPIRMRTPMPPGGGAPQRGGPSQPRRPGP